MTYSAGTAVYGTREEIIQSVVNDLSAITTGAGYSQTIPSAQVSRTYQALTSCLTPTLVVDAGAEVEGRRLAKDLYKKTVTLSVIGGVWSTPDAVEALLETLIRDVELALKNNPRRSISSTAKAWTSEVTRTATRTAEGSGTFVLALTVTYLDNR